MNIAAHYGSYRASLQKDVLEGYVEFAKSAPTKIVEKYPTVYDYIRHIKQRVELAADAGDETDYLYLLKNHQEAMVMLFEEMAKDQCHGFNWLKFSSLVTHFDNGVVVIPRYLAKYAQYYAKCFSADEMRVLSKEPAGLSNAALQRRPAGAVLTSAKGGKLVFTQRKALNNLDAVGDWSTELFHEERE